MKKFLGIITGILFLVILAGCQAKTSATATFFDDEQFLNSIIFSIAIEDPDQEITGPGCFNRTED